MIRVLVCGGRDYSDIDEVCRTLDHIRDTRGEISIIHGGARGADSLAGLYAFDAELKAQVFPADWGTHGKAAGYIRNAQMLAEGKPDLVVGFPGGKGTEMMLGLAEKAGVETLRIEGKNK